MLDKWLNKRNGDHDGRYGDNDTSYEKAAAFLNEGSVEDWGGGTGYAKRFFINQQYSNVDGTNDYCDVYVDLREYKSKVQNILMRHVLEHNVDWKKILLNALESCNKLALVIFTPFGEETKQIAWVVGQEVPDISFRKSDITDCFEGRKWLEETFESEGSVYKTETIFYVYPHAILTKQERLCKQLHLS